MDCKAIWTFTRNGEIIPMICERTEGHPGRHYRTIGEMQYHWPNRDRAEHPVSRAST
jgi:hypothetical protein